MSESYEELESKCQWLEAKNDALIRERDLLIEDTKWFYDKGLHTLANARARLKTYCDSELKEERTARVERLAKIWEQNGASDGE